MLISELQEPFDDPNFIYELKLDEERCIAYLDGNRTVLQNKRAINLNERYPELTQIHKLTRTQSGIALYGLAAQQGLEGVVAKRKDSLYFPGKRTKDWIKFKNLKDDNFVVCGFIEKSGGVVSIVLGQYDRNKLVGKGHVTLGVSRQDFQIISGIPRSRALFVDSEEAVWISPVLVYTVKYMEKTASGMLRQPVFNGLRDDKASAECQIN